MISSLNLLSRIDVSPRAEIYNIVHVMLWSNHSKKAEEEDSRTARARAGDGGRAGRGADLALLTRGPS